MGVFTFFLLLLGGGSSGLSTGSSSATSSGGSTDGADVGEEVLDVLALKSLGEDGGPDGLNFLDLSGAQDGLDLVGL